jgi:hypothetical protein
MDKYYSDERIMEHLNTLTPQLFLRDLNQFLQTQPLDARCADWWEREWERNDEMLVQEYEEYCNRSMDGVSQSSLDFFEEGIIEHLLPSQVRWSMYEFEFWMDGLADPLTLPCPIDVYNAFKIARCDLPTIRALVMDRF